MKIFTLILVPTLLISLAPYAEAMGGKKAQDPSLPSGLVSAVGSHAAAQPVDPALAFANWCLGKLGRLSPDQSRCVTQLNYRYSKQPHSDVWNSEVNVALGDSVTFTATGSPKTLIGLEQGPAESEPHFVANAEGKLAFSAPAKGKKFSVTQVQVRRCFDASGAAVQCGAEETTAEETPRKGSESSRRKTRSAGLNMRRLSSSK